MKKIQDIKLESGTEVLINWSHKDKCRSCGHIIYWGVTKKNRKNIPIEIVGLAKWDNHFLTCPEADKWRKK